MTDTPAIIGATFTIGSALAGCAYYVVRNIVTLTTTMQGLTNTLKEQKEDDTKRHEDTQEAIAAIRDVLGNHETRISLVEQRDPPPAAMRAKRKAG